MYQKVTTTNTWTHYRRQVANSVKVPARGLAAVAATVVCPNEDNFLGVPNRETELNRPTTTAATTGATVYTTGQSNKERITPLTLLSQLWPTVAAVALGSVPQCGNQ